MGADFWLGEKPAKSKYEIGGTGAELQDLMMQRAAGTGGPSAAELMMNRGMQQQVAAGRSAAASMPGVSPGLAMRQAGLRESQAMSDVGQQTGILRAQEQAAAQQMMAQYLQQQDRMRLEQEMYNASRMRQGGMLGPILGTAGAVGGAMIGGPWGASAGSAMGQGIAGGMGAGAGVGGSWGGGGYDPYAAGQPGDYGY
jgi:hypothetical protein